jgi:hypothetical protein
MRRNVSGSPTLGKLTLGETYSVFNRLDSFINLEDE